MVVRWLIQAKIYENYSSEREIKARRVKVIGFTGYNSKIVSAGKDWREEVLKLDQFYLGFVLQSIWLYGALLSFGEFLPYLYFASAVSDIFVINVINNIRIRFIISFYVICAVIYCSFCCIYVWLDPGTYMIARFMSFYKPGVTEWYQSHINCRTKPR